MTELCDHLKNYFIVFDGKHSGVWTIEDEVLPLDFLQANQYYVISGSVFNDGVHQYGIDALTDETFTGTVAAMAIPPALIELKAEIDAYNEKTESVPTAYTSESFGGYSYSKATAENGVAASWQEVFRSRLNKWRKV